MDVVEIVPSFEEYAFTFGGVAPLRRITPGTALRLWSDDAFGGVVTGNAPLYGRLAELMERIADENVDAPLSVARARDTADFLRFLATRMPELVEEWRAQR